MRQFAIGRNAVNGEVDFPVNHIGIAVFHQFLNELDHLVHCFGYSWGGIESLGIQRFSDLVIGFNVSLGNFVFVYALFQCLVDDLVINVGKVGNVFYLVAVSFKNSS